MAQEREVPVRQGSLRSARKVGAAVVVGFVARPLGGVLFGILGDRIGRKAVLSISLLIMGIASGLIGLVPLYAAIGVTASALLIVLRILQGFAASPELGSAITAVYEHADEKTKGEYAAYPVMGAQIGLLAASLVAHQDAQRA